MIPRIALTRQEAAEALGMGSVDSFERHVQPHVRMIRAAWSRKRSWNAPLLLSKIS